MELKERFFNVIFEYAWKFKTEKIVPSCVKIADNYAIEFAEWVKKETYYENLTKEFIYNNNVYKNEKELLEIYKKEKGL